MALVLTVAIATVGPGSTASARVQDVDVEQLVEAVLTPDDLGPGFFVVDGITRTDPPSASRALFRLSADGLLGPDSEQVFVALGADPSVDPVTIADALVDSLRTARRWEDVAVSDHLAAEWFAMEAAA